MPRAVERLRAEAKAASDATWNLMAELLAAVCVWAAIGFGLDKLFGTAPIFVAIGLLIGHGMGIYIAIWRSGQMRKASGGDGRP